MSNDQLIRDLLLGEDVAGQVELLLNLLSDAAAGRELSNVVSEVIQVIIAGGVGHQQVKKLAYELCKAVPLLPSDYSLLVDGIKNDINSGIPEQQVLSLCCLPHLPAEHLTQLLDKGDVANFVVPHTRNVVPAVRSAATTALSAILLVPEVQEAVAASPDLATASSDWWDAVVDGVGDSMPDVLLSSLTATNTLFEAATAAGGSSSTGQPGGSGSSTGSGLGLGLGASTGSVTAAASAALRIATGLGPLLDTWRLLPANAQVSVIQLLGHVWSYLTALDTATAAGAKPTGALLGSGSSTIGDDFGLPVSGLSTTMATAAGGSSNSVVAGLPESSTASLTAALPGILAYLSGMLSSLNPAVKLEACRVLLRLSKAQGARGLHQDKPRLGRLELVGEVPAATAAAAVEVLLELRGVLLVEAALEEVASLLAAHLDVLQVPTRIAVLQRLWPLIAMLQSPTDRLTAFAHAWKAALHLVLDTTAAAAKGQGEGLVDLGTILADPFLDDVISERPAAANTLTGTAAAGPTGASTVTGGAAGPTGGSNPGTVAAGKTGGSVAVTDAVDGLFPEDYPRVSRTLSGSGSRRLLKSVGQSARGVLSSGAALATNVGGVLATAAQSGLSAINLPRLLETPATPRAQLPATLKQELVCTLLEVLQQHPAAQAALQLPPGKPVPPPPPPSATADVAVAAVATAAVQDASSSSPNGADNSPTGPKGQGLQANEQAGDSAVPGAASPWGAAANGLHSPAGAATSSTTAAAAVRPQFGPDDVSTSPVVASLQSQVVLWLGAAVTALQQTRACLHWEPVVPPPMPGQPPTPPLPPLASVNLTTVPVDLWLQLLQAACHAVRGVLRLHGYDSLKAVYRANGGRMLAQLSPWDAGGALARVCESAAAALQQLLSRELSEWRNLALAVRPRVLWVAAHYLELPALLDDTWGVLLGCVEDALLRAGKSEGDARSRQLAVSARDGLLLKRFAMPQLSNLVRDKSGAQTTFDAAAASALVEMPEYKSDGMQVGLTVLQYLVWVVQSTLATAAASAAAAAAAAAIGGKGTTAAAAAAAPGPAEASLARKLLELVKATAAAENSGVDVREWCKRMSRNLNALIDPTGTGAAALAAAGTTAARGGPAFAMAPPAHAAAAGSTGAALPSGYNAVAGFSALGFGGDESSDEDDNGAVGLSRQERLKRKLGLKGSGRNKPNNSVLSSDWTESSDSDTDKSTTSSSSSSSSDTGSNAEGNNADNDSIAGSSDDSGPAGRPLHNPMAGLKLPQTSNQSQNGGQTGLSNDLASAQAAGKQQRAQRRAAKAAKRAAAARAEAMNLQVGDPQASSGVWGYPFGGPRSQTLFISRRSRRHRLFKWQLATAMANFMDGNAGVKGAGLTGVTGSLSGFSSGSSRPSFSGTSVTNTMATIGLTDATGPVFSAESGFRLDQPGFWDSLPGGGIGWVELTGPNDPLVLSGKYSTATASGSATGEITVTLRAFNRLATDLEDIEVYVRLVGSVRAERREAAWVLPKLLPTEAAQHSFKMVPTGYGRMEVHTRLLLPVGQLASESAAAAAAAPSLACQPLVVSLAHLLRPPSCPPGSPQEVMSTWASLPLQVELSATCVWPGIDGLLLLLSAVARQPLYCAWAQLLPGGVCGVQAAFVSAPVTHTSDTIAIMLIGQLMPEPATVEAELAAAAAAARQQDLQQQRDVAAAADGAAATTGDASSSGQQQEQKQQQPEPVLRGVVQLVVRASSHEVTLTIQQHAAAWVNDISQGTLNVGMSAGCAPPRPSRGKTLLHPRVARLEQQLAAAAAVMPPPAQVPPLELPSPPSFRRKLRAKEDEEDSDAEDEELPPTAEEEVQQAAALDKHKEACEKAAAAHAAAKRARATAVLRKAALAEWRRAACPTPL